MTQARRSLLARASRAAASALLCCAAAAQEETREGPARTPLDDAATATQVLTAPATPRLARREAAEALLFRFGSEGLDRAEIALHSVAALSVERELKGTVEGQVLEALCDELEERAAGGMDLDPALLRLAPDLLRLVARREGQRGSMRSSSAARSLRALLESNLRSALQEGLRAFLRPEAALDLRKAALIALPRLRAVELCFDVAVVAFGESESAPLRRLAQESLVGLAQRGFASQEEFLRWRESDSGSALLARDLAWVAGERLRAELLAARENLVTHASGDLDLLLELLGDPTFPRVRAGAARELGGVVARFAPERDADPLQRVMGGLVRGVRHELHPEVLVEMAICLRNLAPLAGAADRCVERARGDAELAARCEQFRLHIKPLRDLLIDLAPTGRAAEGALWSVRARAVEALRWFPVDLLVQTHVIELLEQVLVAPEATTGEGGADYADFRRAVFRTAAEMELAGPPSARALVLIRRLSSDKDLDVRRSALPLLRALGANEAVGEAVRETLLGLAQKERDAGVRAEALGALASVAERVAELRPTTVEIHVTALSDPERSVRELAAAWFVRVLGSPLWKEHAAPRFGPVLAERLRAGGESDARVRAALARAACEGLRLDWLEKALAHLGDEELRAAARWLRLELERTKIEEEARLELAVFLGTRLPDVAFALIDPDPAAEAEERSPAMSERRDRLLLRLGWEAFARLERFAVLPPILSVLESERLKKLLVRAERWPAAEDERLLRADLQLRGGSVELVLRELPAQIQELPPEQRGPLLDRLIAANWSVLRWTEVASLATRRERECGRSASWCVAAMVFEAQIARDRAEGRASAAERVRDAQRLVAGEGDGVDGLSGVKRTLSLLHVFQRQDLAEEAQLLLAALQPVLPLPRALEREIAAMRAIYR